MCKNRITAEDNPCIITIGYAAHQKNLMQTTTHKKNLMQTWRSLLVSDALLTEPEPRRRASV